MNIRWKVAQAAEIIWWKRYLSDKAPADYLRQKAMYWRRVLAAAGKELVPGERILDAGCGPAGIFIILQEQRVDALDPLLEQYRRSLPHFEPGHYPQVRFYAEPLEGFRAPEPYDTVFCLNAINHVARLQPCLEVLADSLAPGGQLYISVDVHRYTVLKKLFQWLPGDILHPHQYSLAEYRQMLEDNGLQAGRSIRLKKGLIFDYALLVGQKK